MLTRRVVLGTTAGLVAPAIVRAQGSTPVRIGEINSYTAAPAFTVPYRNGWQVAVDEINAQGGVSGRRIEVLSRDDAGQPQTATRLAGEPLTDALVWDRGNPTCFRLRPSTYMQLAMMMPAAAKLKATRWATVAPNYEYGQSAVRWFKTLLKVLRPDVEFVGDQFRRSARSTPGRRCRRWPTSSLTASSTCCSAPTSPTSCAKATRAGYSRGATSSLC